MSEDKKSLIDLVPDSVDNAVKNITDKPTQNIGTTLADIWYLVFGGISQAAEKRKLKYSYALQEFEKELKEKISKIPENKLIEPDMQIVAPALEASKYCIEKEELRHMFAKLIYSSLNEDFKQKVHPIYVKIINNLTPFDAKVLNMIYQRTLTSCFDKNSLEVKLRFDDIVTSICILENLGIIYFDQNYDKLKSSSKFIHGDEKILYFNTDNLNNIRNIGLEGFTTNELMQFIEDIDSSFSSKILNSIVFTKLGLHFTETCL